MAEVKRVQRNAWSTRDQNAKREAARYLLPELDVDPEEPEEEQEEKHDGARFGRNEIWEELREMFGDGYESYEGNPASLHEKRRLAMLKKEMEDMARKQALKEEMLKDEEEKAILDLSKTTDNARIGCGRRPIDPYYFVLVLFGGSPSPASGVGRRRVPFYSCSFFVLLTSGWLRITHERRGGQARPILGDTASP